MRTAVIAALLSIIGWTTSASADVWINGSPGGEVQTFIHHYQDIARTGQRVVINGPCLSACTFILRYVPRSRVCVTNGAVLGFHEASYYDDAARQLRPTRAGTRIVMNIYPPAVRRWIRRHGGLTSHMLTMQGPDLQRFYPTCK